MALSLRFRMACTVAILLAATLPAFPQDTAWQGVFSGKQFPLSLHLKDLDATWTHVLVNDPADIAELARAIGLGNPGIYYTQGQTFNAGGQVFLAAYRPSEQTTDVLGILQGAPGSHLPPQLTADTSLALCLLNVATMRTLNDIRPFNLQQELDSSGSVKTVLDHARDSALKTESESNLKQAGLATLMYSQDYDEKMPPTTSPKEWKAAVYPYIKSESVFLSPKTKEPYLVNPYLSKKSITNVAAPADTPLAWEASPWEDGSRCVLYLDGHVKSLTASAWDALRKSGHMPADAAGAREAPVPPAAGN